MLEDDEANFSFILKVTVSTHTALLAIVIGKDMIIGRENCFIDFYRQDQGNKDLLRGCRRNLKSLLLALNLLPTQLKYRYFRSIILSVCCQTLL